LADGLGRRLIWVPILHEPVDLGSLRDSARAAHSRASWERYARAANEFWRETRRKVERLPLDWSRVRLYQDALPACGFEERIVRELAAKGGGNHRLLADLMARGATLEGTESPQLLAEEYRLQARTLAGDPPPNADQLARELLEARDQYVADRVASTLREGEVGIVFLGAAHSLEGRLPGDVRVERWRG
jgi:hypothetical protein